MGKSIYRIGTVLQGDYNGKNIYKKDDDSLIIVSDDEFGKIIVHSLFPTRYTTLKTISKDTVERYEDISSSERGANPSAVADGLLWLGPVGGLLGAVASQSTDYDIAVYFKDGTKSLIRMFSSSSYQELKKILFKF